MESQAALSAVTAFTLILDGLMRTIAARIQDYPFTGEMVTYLWQRVNTVKNRFLALAARIEAGKTPRERAAKPRARKTRDGARAGGKINWRKWLPMARFACLCWIMPSRPDRFGAAQFGDQLRHLLGRAEMRALLAATPKAARLLKPLCFMLGIEDSLLQPACQAPPSPAARAPDSAMSETSEPGSHDVPCDDFSRPARAERMPRHPPNPPPEPAAKVFVPA